MFAKPIFAKPIAGSRPAIAEVEPDELRRWLADGEALLVDVREADEFAEEHIAGAHHLPLSVFAADALPAAPGKRLVLHCLSGGRSAKAGLRLLEAGHNQALHLAGGLLAWKAAGGPTVPGRD